MRATPSTEPSHRRRRETAVARRCSISSSLGESACGAVRSDCQILAGDTPPARTERVPTSASSRRHSPRVRACRRTKTLDGRDRVRRRGVSPTGSETFRYIFSDLTVLGLRLLPCCLLEAGWRWRSHIISTFAYDTPERAARHSSISIKT
jgi:hypothetical protein